MLCNNLIASSSLASQRANEFNFSCQYDSMIVQPKAVSLTKAIINNTLNSFRDNQLSLYIQTSPTEIATINLVNSYYDTVTEFMSMLNNIAGLSAIGITFTYDTGREALKVINTHNTPFSVKGASYNSASNIGSRLGFNANQDYTSYSESSNQVVYASSPIKLLRTSCFFVCSNICTVQTAAPGYHSNIIDCIPVDVANLKYGDVIILDRSNISTDIPVYDERKQRTLPSNSQFDFQLLDDEFQAITDKDKGLNTILFFNFDYN